MEAADTPVDRSRLFGRRQPEQATGNARGRPPAMSRVFEGFADADNVTDAQIAVLGRADQGVSRQAPAVRNVWYPARGVAGLVRQHRSASRLADVLPVAGRSGSITLMLPVSLRRSDA